jgi:TP901 family phage tail tape measure protein
MSRKRTSVIQVMITGDAKDLNRATQSGSKGMGLLGAAAITAAKVVTSAVSAIAGFSIREFAKFDDAMVKSTAIMGDLSDTMRNDMSDAARQVALTTTFAADEAAEAFFFLASAGLNAEQSIAALPKVAQFAQAGAFDLALATDLLTDAQSALGMSSDDTAQHLAELVRISDVLVGANTLANASVEQFSAALTNKAGAALRIMGKDIEEGVAALALLADRGVKGAEAGERLSIMLRDVTRAAARSPQDFQRLGLSVLDTEGNLRNIADVTEEFTRVLGGMSDAQAANTLESLGLTRSVGDVIRLMFDGADQIRTYEEALRGAGGATEDVANKQLQSFNAQLSLLGSAFSDVGITIGTALSGPLGEFVAFVQSKMPAVKDFFEWEFTTAFAFFVEKAKIEFRKFKAFFEENLEQPLINFKNLLVEFGTIGLENLSIVLERVKTFASDFKAAVDDNDPSEAGNALGEFIAETFRQALQRAGDLGDALLDWAGAEDWADVGRQVGEIAVPFFTGFIKGLFSKPDEADAEFDTIFTTLRERFISTVVGAAVLSKVPVFGGIFKLFLGFIKLAFLAIGTALGGAVTPILGSTLLGSIWAAITGVFSRLAILMGDGSRFARFVVRPLANGFRLALALLGFSVNASTMRAAEAIRTLFRSKFSLFLRSGFVQGLTTFVRLVIGPIAKAGVALVVGFLTWPVVLTAAAVAALTVFIIRFRNWFNQQEGEFENIGSAVVTFIAQGFQKLGQWFNDTIIQWFRDRITQFSDWVDRQVGDYENIGSAIVSGIANGITNGASKIINAARNAARSAFDAAKDFLGIQSPSTLFMQVGDDIMAGMSLGIDRSSVDAVRAMVGASQDLAGVNFSAPTVPAGPRQGGGDIYITVNGALDSEGVARQIERVLRDSRRRTGGVLV